MKNSKLALFSIFSLTLAAPTHAALFQITDREAVGVPEQAFNAALDEIEDQINANLPAAQPGDYTQGMANAVAMAGTGTSAVYGSSFRYGLIGAGVGLGLDLGDTTFAELMSGDASLTEIGGLGLQAAAIVGVSPGAFTSGKWFGVIDPARLRVYFSMMSMSRAINTATVQFSNFGLVGQYRLVPEKSLGMNLVKWNGVDVSTGLRYQKMKFGTSVTETITQEIVTGSDAVINAEIDLGVDVGVFTVPLEASTSLRLLYVINLVGGLGADLNFGSSKATADLTAPITFTGVASGSEATAAMDLGDKKGPTIVNARAFGGLQFEFGIGALYATLQKSMTASIWGLNLGLNLNY